MKKQLNILIPAILCISLSGCGGCTSTNQTVSTMEPTTEIEVSENEMNLEDGEDFEQVKASEEINEELNEELRVEFSASSETEKISMETESSNEDNKNGGDADITVDTSWQDYFRVEYEADKEWYEGTVTVTDLMIARSAETEFFAGCTPEEIAWYYNMAIEELPNGLWVRGPKWAMIAISDVEKYKDNEDHAQFTYLKENNVYSIEEWFSILEDGTYQSYCYKNLTLYEQLHWQPNTPASTGNTPASTGSTTSSTGNATASTGSTTSSTGNTTSTTGSTSTTGNPSTGNTTSQTPTPTTQRVDTGDMVADARTNIDLYKAGKLTWEQLSGNEQCIAGDNRDIDEYFSNYDGGKIVTNGVMH